MRLYSFKESGNCYKIRLLVKLLNIPNVETIEVNLEKGEQEDPQYLKVNPKGEVPALVDGDLLLCDSAAILVYLAGKYAPKATWWSEDSTEQALICEWLAYAASWVQFGVFTARGIVSMGGSQNGLGSRSDEVLLETATVRGNKSLEYLNETLASRKWLALGRPTIADLANFPYIALAPMGNISLEPYPNVLKWINNIRQLPHFFPLIGMDDPSYKTK